MALGGPNWVNPAPIGNPSLSDQPLDTGDTQHTDPIKFIMDLLNQRLQAQPPQAKPRSKGRKFMDYLDASAGMNRHPELAQHWLNERRGINDQESAAYQNSQAQIPDLIRALSGLEGRQMTQEGMQARQKQTQRFQTTRWDPARKQNVMVNEYRDPRTFELQAPPGSPPGTPPHLEDAGNPALRYGIASDEYGHQWLIPMGSMGDIPLGGDQAQQSGPPRQPGLPKPAPTPNGPPADPSAKPTRFTVGTSPAVTFDKHRPTPPMPGAIDTGLNKVVPANLAGIQQQLDNADRLITEMETNYKAGPSGGIMRGIGTAGANLLGGETGGKLGLSGIASAIDQHAVIHERDRNAAATALAFPLTGSRRAIEGARQSLLGVIPHYSDPPEVWQVFSRQMRDLIATARKMPWGTDPNRTAEMYGQALDQTFGLSTGASSGGKQIRKSDFDRMSPQGQQEALADGVQVMP